MRKSLLLSAAFTVGALGLVPVHAQNENAAAAAQSGGIETVVVTAEKRTEKVTDIPVSVSVLSTIALMQSNVGDITDLNKLVPSVEFNGTFNGRVPIAIRGISSGANEFTVGLSLGVALMVDGIPVPSDSMAANQVEDITNVEVLKGPQATLGGRTAAAGVINFVTHAPTAEFEGSINGTVTSDSEQRVNGFVSGPITDNVEFSLSGYYTHRDFPIYNLYDDKHSSQISAGTRGKIMFNLTPDLDITLTGHVANTVSLGDNFVYVYLTPGSTLLFPGSPLTPALLLDGITPSLHNDKVNTISQGTGSRLSDVDGNINIEYRMGGYSLVSTTSYSKELAKNTQDLFSVDIYFWQYLTGGFAPPFYNMEKQKLDVSQTTEELKLVSPSDGWVTFVTGLYFSDTQVNEVLDREFIPATQLTTISSDTKTIDLYGRATWKITDTTSLLTGLRYNYDFIKYYIDQTEWTPYGAESSGHSATFSTLVGDVSLQQKLTPKIMIYGTYARGYSPAAYDTSQALYDSNPLTPVAAERIDNFEIGSKGVLLDGTLSYDMALFDTLYSNYQVQTPYIKPGMSVSNDVLVAAGKAETRGVEFNASYFPTDLLELNLEMAYIDAKFDKFKDAPCYGEDEFFNEPAICTLNSAGYVQDMSKHSMPNSPNFKFVLDGHQRIPIEALPFDLVLGAEYAYRTKTYMLADHNPEAIQGAFGILNLSLAAQSKSEQYSLSFFVNNVFDQHYYTDFEDFWTSPWSGQNTVNAQPARDFNRYFGARLSANF